MRAIAALVLVVATGADGFVVTRPPAIPLLSHKRTASVAPMVMQQRQSGSRGLPLAVPMPSAAAEHPWWRRALKQLLVTTSVVGAAVLLRAPGAVSPAMAAPSKSPTAGKKAASVSRGQQAMSTIVLAGGLAYWGVRTAMDEDDEETVRIKEETEKLEKITKEFTDIDEGVTNDADLLASLRKRMGNSTDADDDSDGSDPSAEGGGGGAATLDRPPEDSGGGAAVLEPPAEPPAEPPTASQDDIDKLKRMFGSSDDA